VQASKVHGLFLNVREDSPPGQRNAVNLPTSTIFYNIRGRSYSLIGNHYWYIISDHNIDAASG